MSARSLKDELLGLEAREDEISAKLAATPEPKVYLAPNMADIYRERVDGLQQALAAGGERDQAHEAIRDLIDAAKADIVRRIFREYMAGRSPQTNPPSGPRSRSN